MRKDKQKSFKENAELYGEALKKINETLIPKATKGVEELLPGGSPYGLSTAP